MEVGIWNQDRCSFLRPQGDCYAAAALKFIAATDLAAFPSFRGVVRNRFRLTAVVSTKPTEKVGDPFSTGIPRVFLLCILQGKQELDPAHPYFGLHVIKEKPLTEFLEKRLRLGEKPIHVVSDSGITDGIAPRSALQREKALAELSEGVEYVLQRLMSVSASH